jgi:CDP-6-deoxy-D-xylo-4-hexulose-3-dehydrase
MIKLVKDTIDKQDIDCLVDWLKTYPQLTKGRLTEEYEKRWSEWLGVKYSVFVNSGSSANLAAVYSLKVSGKLRNLEVIVPAVSWSTTVSPIMQLGLNPIMCDADSSNMGLDLNHLREIVRKHKPSMAILVHVLGIPNHMEEIVKICKENDIFLIEDSCESIGSLYDQKKIGTFGDISTFSFYYGHHISTIEGGIISTNNEDLYDILLSIRSHGWDRDLRKEKQQQLRSLHGIEDFRALYTFYYPGFNIRPTEISAFLGLKQLEKIETVIKKRNDNFLFYQENIKNTEWKVAPPANSFVSNFAYPIIHSRIDQLIKHLTLNNIEIRPLVCGSIGHQPFWIEKYGRTFLQVADKIHSEGIYIPNNHQLHKEEVIKIVDVVNDVLVSI